MELLIQMGWQTRPLACDLIDTWQSGTVILSPRDTEDLTAEAAAIRAKKGGAVLLDPQIYNPHASHHRLTEHAHWPIGYSTADFLTNSSARRQMIAAVYKANEDTETFAVILPGLDCKEVNDTWSSFHRKVIDESTRQPAVKERFATLALSQGLLISESLTEDVIEEIDDWNVDGFYIVAEHPNRAYLVQNKEWLYHLLRICYACKKLHKKVIVGYAGPQLLCLSLVNVDAIASGPRISLRSFDIEHFDQTESSGGGGKKPIYYYHPTTLSEFALSRLETAYSKGVFDLFNDPQYDLSYTQELFTPTLFPVSPTSSRFRQADSFRHYLHSLSQQCKKISASSYQQAWTVQQNVLDQADQRLSAIHAAGIAKDPREFSKVLKVNRAALDLFNKNSQTRFMLNRVWPKCGLH